MYLCEIHIMHMVKLSPFQRTAAVGNVGAAVVVHVDSSSRSRTDAVICN